MKIVFISFFLLFIFQINYAQRIEISPVLGYGHFKLNLDTKVDKYLVESPSEIEESNHIGLTAKFYFKKNRYYIQPTFTYGNEVSGYGYSVTNTDRNLYEYYDTQGKLIFYYNEFISLGYFIPPRVYKTSIVVGTSLWKPHKRFGVRGFAGFAVDYRTEKDRAERRASQRNRRQPPEGYAPVDDITFDIAVINAERDWILNGQVGIGIDIGKFWLDLSYHKSFTPLSKDIVYYDKSYYYRSKTKQLLFTLGWNIGVKK